MDSLARRKEERELSLYYIYCFSLATEPFSLQEKGMEGENNVFPLSYHDLSALVSHVPLSIYSEQALNENLQNLEWLSLRVKRHEQLVRAAMQFGPVIPVRFCTLYKSRARILTVLRNHDEHFRAFLDFVRDKEEWGVKIYIADGVGKNLLQKASPALQTLDERVSSASAGEKYFLRKKREQLLREEVEQHIEALTSAIYDQLSSWSVADRRNHALDRLVTGRDEDMIFNAAFLLDKKNVGNVVEWLNRLATEYESRGLFFEMSGPWPPYNFCPCIQ